MTYAAGNRWCSIAVVVASLITVSPEWPTFADVSAEWRVAGFGVAVCEADRDDLLDLCFVNGAKLDVAIRPGEVPRKTSPDFWNRLFVQRPGNRFVDVTKRAGVASPAGASPQRRRQPAHFALGAAGRDSQQP
jgi:hypothetical protein